MPRVADVLLLFIGVRARRVMSDTRLGMASSLRDMRPIYQQGQAVKSYDFRYEVGAVKAPTGLVITGRAYFDRIVSSLPDGQECVLTLTPKKDKKTNRQVRGLFGPMYSSIIEFLLTDQGYRRDEWPKMKELIHEGLCTQYQGFVTCPITKKDVRKFRLSRATKQETSDYMNWLGQYMAEEHHFVVQMPGETE